MSQRLQVLMDDKELREIKRLAKREGLTVAAWVRQTLRAAREREPERTARRKLDALEAAVGYSFPTADIDPMLDEIERGYRDAAPE
jgi:hypothetical protein